MVTYMTGYWKQHDYKAWVKCPKVPMKQFLISGKCPEDSKIPLHIQEWINQERGLLGVVGFIGDKFISDNKHASLAYLFHIMQFWEDIKSQSDRKIKLKAFTIAPLYSCSRIHITLDDRFLYCALGYRSKITEKRAQNLLTMTDEEKQLLKDDKDAKKKVTKDWKKAVEEAKENGEPIPKRTRKRNKTFEVVTGAISKERQFLNLGPDFIRQLWYSLFKCEKYETGEWKFGGVVKTDGICVSFLYEKTVLASEASRDYKIPLEELKGKRIISVDPGRKNIATAAEIELQDGVPIVKTVWKLTRRQYYEEAGFFTEAANKRKWNKPWMNTPEFKQYKKTSFKTLSIQNFMTSVRTSICSSVARKTKGTSNQLKHAILHE